VLRTPEVALAVLAFGVSAYFFQAGGWNQNSRFDLTRAIVEQHSLTIDDYVGNTGDYSVRGGHFYSDKAPGLSFLAVPVWSAVHPFAHGRRPRGRLIHLGAYLSTLWGVALPSALGVAMLFRIAVRWGASVTAAAVLAVSYAFGTQALPYSTLFYSHQLVAGLLLLALALITEGRERPEAVTPRRLFVVGLLLGYAIASEYPAALAGAMIVGYAALVVRRRRRLVWTAVGAAIPILGLATYHAGAWGDPFITGYTFTIIPGRDTGGLLPGVTLPDPTLLPKLLFSLERGIIRFSPWLALALPGAVVMLRRRWLRAEGLLCVAVIAAFLALNCAQTVTPDDWRGGAGLGPRYLVPSLPFYALAMVGLVVPRWSGWRAHRLVRGLAAAVFVALVALSAGRMLLATAVQPEVSRVDDPFADYLLPLWRDDRVAVNVAAFYDGGNKEPKFAWNLGEQMGLSGRASLLPLAVFVLAAGAWLTTRVIRAKPSTLIPSPRTVPAGLPAG
jgi:hypothetical protein